MKKYSLYEIEDAILNHDNCGTRSEESQKKRYSNLRSIKSYLEDRYKDKDKEITKEK
jgi:hypothetical protein